MAKPEVYVGRILGTGRGKEGSVELEGTPGVRVEKAALLPVLEGLRQQGLPAYLEIDAQSRTLLRLFIPHVGRVVAVTPHAKGLAVELEHSHALHFLPTGAEGAVRLEGVLREALSKGAPVLLAEDDAHNVLEVRFFEFGAREVRGPAVRPTLHPKPLYIRFLLWPWWPWMWWRWFWWSRWCRCLSPEQAQRVFDTLASTTCNPSTVPPPCIPFLYPDDGCWGRAHEMCRLMIGMGHSPRKVWIQGSLQVSTANNPNCAVYWGWHVAPTLCVRTGFFTTEQMVFDPSLFTTPVAQATWKGVQGDPNATLTPSSADIFYLWTSETDPTYSKTNQVLAIYRLKLQNRTAQHGPPPYANCP